MENKYKLLLFNWKEYTILYKKIKISRTKAEKYANFILRWNKIDWEIKNLDSVTDYNLLSLEGNKLWMHYGEHIHDT